MRKNLIIFIFFISTITFWGQFGKNKVQYKNYEWYYIKNKFWYYFTLDGKNIAEFTANIAEKSFTEDIQESLLIYEVYNRIPILGGINFPKNDFSRKLNATGFHILGTGELVDSPGTVLKNRVSYTILRGDYSQFRPCHSPWTLSCSYSGYALWRFYSKNYFKGITLQLPLWYHEGMGSCHVVGIRIPICYDWMLPLWYFQIFTD